MTNELIKLGEKDIENKIYEIRGVQVMLDSEMSVIKWHDYNIWRGGNNHE